MSNESERNDSVEHPESLIKRLNDINRERARIERERQQPTLMEAVWSAVLILAILFFLGSSGSALMTSDMDIENKVTIGAFALVGVGVLFVGPVVDAVARAVRAARDRP